MSLAAAARIGPYEIVAPLGSGGMGEVYRARDARLGRDVAIKVLPPSYSEDQDRLRRFEQEARAAAGLSHPNLLAVHDIGTQNGSPYIVTELLEGETLRARLHGGALPVRKATDYALQIALGLAAAHEKAIVHRDLKPDNIFLTRDGRVKILDFGLAKLIEPDTQQNRTSAPTMDTTPGVVLGTVGYMSPEQVRGVPADHRSDLFSFGAILYEMLSGKRAFKGDTSADTMSSILKDDPPELTETNRSVSPALERIVRHCLEKNPGERFQSARDVAFDLESLSNVSGTSGVLRPLLPTVLWRRSVPILLVVPLLLMAILGGLWGGHRSAIASPVFTRLTYQSGYVASARFSPDGKTIVYGAGIAGNPVEIYTTRSDAPQSRPLGFNHTTVLAISKNDEMAIAVDQRAIAANSVKGTLAQVPLTGGAPRELLEDVRYADWSPDGTELAVVREVGGRDQLEYPLGKVLYQTDGWISHTRVSPDGARVAFIDHPVTFDSRGAIAFVDRNARKTVLTQVFSDVLGLAWHPTGKEIWFTGAAEHLSSSLLAVTLAGKQRTVWSAVGGVVLQDISHNGRVLLTRNNRRRGIAGLFPGHDRETDLSWFDWSLPLDMSADGKWITFSEQGDSAGPKYSAYMRATDGSPAIRLGEGTPTSLSPDGKWVASIIPGEPQRLLILPTRAGESRDISAPGFSYGSAYWLDDGKRLVVLASQNGQQYRFWIQDATGGRPRPATPEGAVGVAAWPGQKLIIATRDGKTTFYPIDGGPPQVPTNELPADLADAVSRDDRYLYGIQGVGEVPAKVLRYDRVTGRTEPWKELAPPERAGVYTVGPIIVAPGGRYYAYSYVRDLADLYMVEGLR